jgi:hypothetical protein
LRPAWRRAQAGRAPIGRGSWQSAGTLTPVAGEDIQKLVQHIYATPAAVVRKTAELLQ